MQSEKLLLYDSVKQELEERIRRLEEDRHNTDISSGMFPIYGQDEVKLKVRVLVIDSSMSEVLMLCNSFLMQLDIHTFTKYVRHCRYMNDTGLIFNFFILLLYF